jgi:mannose-6-phosphate isomerase-like protein (cupin superfamily)
LSRIALAPHSRYAGDAPYGPKALLVLEGSGAVNSGGQSLGLGRGSIAFVPCGTQFVLETREEDFVVFQAGLPRHARGAE